MTAVWVVIEDCHDYYKPERMIGIATSEEEVNRLIEKRKATIPYKNDYEYFSYPTQLNELDI